MTTRGVRARAAAVALLAAAAVATPGCKREREIAGFEQWHVSRTKRKDADGRCLPEQLADGRAGAYCFGQQPVGLRGMRVEVDLLFAGMEPDAVLVEIQLKVGGCNEEKLDGWLRTNLGAPVQGQGRHHAWRNRHLLALAYLPLADEPGRCLVRMLPRREQARFDALWAKATAPAAPAAPE